MLAGFTSLRSSSCLIIGCVFTLAMLSAAATPAPEDGCCGPGAGQAASAPHNAGGEMQQPAEIKSDPYPLDVCPVSGDKLGSMGDPVVKTYGGREVRFCCGGCIKKFEADKDAYWKKIDKEIIETQLPFYPLTECLISGGKLGSMGDPIDHVYNNRLVRFCCNGCLPKFNKDPKATLEKLDEAVIKQQGEHYPMTVCLVSGEALGGDMGEPVERVYNNHLVRLCCKGCIKEFEKTPATFLSALDDAWKKQGGVPGAEAAGQGREKGQGEHENHGGGSDERRR